MTTTRIGPQFFSATAQEVAAFTAALGRQPTFGSIYYSFDEAAKLAGNADLQGLLAVAGVPWVNVNLSYRDSGGTKVGVSWKEVIAGAHDAVLQQWADAFKALGAPRLIYTVGGHEPNVRNNPLQPKAADYDLHDYPALAHKIHSFFHAAGVTNRIGVCPTGSAFVGNPPLVASFLPDLADYDVLGTDLYNHCDKWAWPAVKAGAVVRTAQAAGKHILVGELGNDCADARRPTWYEQALQVFADAGAIGVSLNLRTDPTGDYGLQPGTPEWSAVMVKVASWR